MELTQSSILFLLSPMDVFVGDSLSSHDTFMAHTMHVLPFQSINPSANDHGVCTITLLCIVDLTVQLWRPHCTLIRMPSHGVCFEHAQSAHRHSPLYEIQQLLLAMPLRCCEACHRTVRTSAAFYWALWDCCENATLV